MIFQSIGEKSRGIIEIENPRVEEGEKGIENPSIEEE
jgi:hypothetical protein